MGIVFQILKLIMFYLAIVAIKGPGRGGEANSAPLPHVGKNRVNIAFFLLRSYGFWITALNKADNMKRSMRQRLSKYLLEVEPHLASLFQTLRRNI